MNLGLQNFRILKEFRLQNARNWWILDLEMLEFWFYTNSGSGLMLHNFDCLVASFQSSIGQKFECGLSRVEK